MFGMGTGGSSLLSSPDLSKVYTFKTKQYNFSTLLRTYLFFLSNSLIFHLLLSNMRFLGLRRHTLRIVLRTTNSLLHLLRKLS